MLVRRALIPEHLHADLDRRRGEWPLSVPCVAELLATPLEFVAPITFLVGENGSGKSTVIEALAEAYGLDARGGRAGRKYTNRRPKTPLGRWLALDPLVPTVGGKRRGYFLRAETAFGFMQAVQGMRGYWEEDAGAMSHGEGFLTVLETMFADPGLYLMDEPESALSFTSCLHLIRVMRDLAEAGGQVICATHSPLLAATPGAEVVEIDETGFRRTSWDALMLVDHWRRFLARPDAYLDRLLDDVR